MSYGPVTWSPCFGHDVVYLSQDTANRADHAWMVTVTLGHSSGLRRLVPQFHRLNPLAINSEEDLASRNHTPQQGDVLRTHARR